MKKGWLLIEGEGKGKMATTTTTLTSNCNIENAKKHTWIFFSVNIDIRLPFYSFFIKISMDTGSKLNVHRTFRRGFGRLLKVLDFFLMFFGLKRPTCMLNLRPVSRVLAFGNVFFLFVFIMNLGLSGPAQSKENFICILFDKYSALLLFFLQFGWFA